MRTSSYRKRDVKPNIMITSLLKHYKQYSYITFHNKQQLKKKKPKKERKNALETRIAGKKKKVVQFSLDVLIYIYIMLPL